MEGEEGNTRNNKEALSTEGGHMKGDQDRQYALPSAHTIGHGTFLLIKFKLKKKKTSTIRENFSIIRSPLCLLHKFPCRNYKFYLLKFISGLLKILCFLLFFVYMDDGLKSFYKLTLLVKS